MVRAFITCLHALARTFTCMQTADRRSRIGHVSAHVHSGLQYLLCQIQRAPPYTLPSHRRGIGSAPFGADPTMSGNEFCLLSEPVKLYSNPFLSIAWDKAEGFLLQILLLVYRPLFHSSVP